MLTRVFQSLFIVILKINIKEWKIDEDGTKKGG